MAESAPIITPVIVGAFTLLGVVVGIVAERLARTLGKITCEPQEEWEPVFGLISTRTGDSGQSVSHEYEVGETVNSNHARYSVTLDLFNSKELPVGLRSIRIIFDCEGGSVVNIPDEAPPPKLPGTITPGEQASILNLPSRQLVSLRFQGNSIGEDVQTLRRWKTAKFVAEYPGSRLFSRGTFSKVIARRKDQ